MRNRTKKRALRVIAGAIISSDLSLVELAELAEALRRDSQLPLELGRLLEQTVRGIEPSHGLMESHRSRGSVDMESVRVVDQIMAVLNRRRKGKKAVIAWLQGLGDRYVKLDPAGTLREIVKQYVTLAPAATLEQLRADLGLEGATVDPYLKGIMKKQARGEDERKPAR